jgi:hypothetical protein
MFAVARIVNPQHNGVWHKTLLMALLVSATWCAPAGAGLFDDTPSSTPPPPPKREEPVPPAFQDTPPAAPPKVVPVPAPRPTQAPASTPAPAPATRPARLPVPGEAQQWAGEQSVKEVFGTQIAEARTPENRGKLSGRMLETAGQTPDAPGKFALLWEAETLAVQAGDVNAALAARNVLRGSFDLGAWAPAREMFIRLDRNMLSAEDRQKLCAATLDAADDAFEADQFAPARQMGEQAMNSARRANDHDLSDRATSLLTRITTCETEKKRIAPAFATLAARATDPQANAAVGKYECFSKRDWDRGLPMLARGDDAGLRTLAQQDLKAPSTANQQLAIADAWWTFGEAQPPTTRSSIRLRAGMWYAQAAGALSGLMKLKADQRAADYLKMAASKPDQAIAGAGGADAVIHGPIGVVRAIPASLFPATLAGWDDDHRQAVNAALRTAVVGHTGEFTITVKDIQRGQSALLTDNVITQLGQFTVLIDSTFDPNDQGQWASIRPARVYRVSGHIERVLFNNAQLYCSLTNCRLLGPGVAQNTVANGGSGGAPQPGRGAGATGKANYASLDEVLAAVPVDAVPQSTEEWKDRTIGRRFADAFTAAFGNKAIRCEINIGKVSHFKGISKTAIHSEKYSVGSTNLTLVMFLQDGDPRLEKLTTGTHCSVSGHIHGQGWGPGGLTMTIDSPVFTVGP